MTINDQPGLRLFLSAGQLGIGEVSSRALLLYPDGLPDLHLQQVGEVRRHDGLERAETLYVGNVRVSETADAAEAVIASAAGTRERRRHRLLGGEVVESQLLVGMNVGQRGELELDLRDGVIAG